MKFLITIIVLMTSLASAADNYVFKVQAEDDSLRAAYITEDADLPLWVAYQDKDKKRKAFYRIYVTEAQYNNGWDALPQVAKDAGKDTALDQSSEADKSSIDAQALIETIAEITGTPVNDVKQKFKTHKKDKEKNK